MESIFFSLVLLACPVGMGLMMWFMGKGTRQKDAPSAPATGASVEQLREEHRRLGSQIERLDGEQTRTTAGRT